MTNPLLHYLLSIALFGDTLSLFRCRRVSNDTLKRHFKPFLSPERATERNDTVPQDTVKASTVKSAYSLPTQSSLFFVASLFECHSLTDKDSTQKPAPMYNHFP